MEWITRLCPTLIWIMQVASAQLPVRSYDGVITGHDPRLQLDNTSVCDNYSDKVGIGFQRLILHNDTVYVGATNHILQVEVPNFVLTGYATIGPYNDDPGCVGPPICGISCGTLRCVDNRIRLLLPHRDQLIACGNTYAGTCNLLSIKNVSQPYEPTPDVRTLKCDPDSQIAKETGDIAVASVFTHGQDVGKDLMYVGAGGPVKTYYPPGSGGPFPNLSFKKIDDTSKYAETELNKQVQVTTWTTSTHNFMLWNSVSESQAVISRLCHATLNELGRRDLITDQGYGKSAYTESSIECEGYITAVLGFYRYGKLFVLFKRGSRYKLCSTMENSINRHFLEARQSCFEGDSNKAEHVHKNCQKITLETDELARLLTCGVQQDQSHYVNPVRCKEKLQFKEEFDWPAGEEAPTSVAIDLVNGFTSGFFGMPSGEIKKAQMGSKPYSFSESIILEEGSPVLQDVGFDSTKQFMYAMTPNKLFKVKLSNCQQYTTCGSCLSSNDPYCGWCVLRSRCTQKSECDQIDRNWMKVDEPESQCPHVADVQPNALSVSHSETLSLTLGGKALPASNYECEFAVAGEVLSSSQLNIQAGKTTCSSPPTPPEVPQGQDNVNVTLRIKADTAIVATGSFSIYDCNKIPNIKPQTMCSSCSKSVWNCSWCSTSKSCEDNCPDGDEIPHKDLCPSVLEVTDSTVDIPVDKPKEFVLRTKNLPQLDYDCVLDICDSASQLTVSGVREGDLVKCNVEENQLKCPKEDSTVTIFLQSGNYIIDTPRVKTVSVGLFNCSGNEPECGLCIISHSRHPECAWCEENGVCVPQTDCNEGGATNISSCPGPVIETVEPLTGPMDGGTEISLSGSNLGSRPEEIVWIVVGGGQAGGPEVECKMMAERYVPSKRIICKTNASKQAPVRGLVRVQMSYAEDEVISKETFTFKRVSAEDFSPLYALNGSKLTIRGQNLDVGNTASVSLAKRGREVKVECGDRTSQSMVCVLVDVQSAGRYSLSTSVDGYHKKMGDTIQFLPPPEIIGLAGPREKLVSFYSGGLLAVFEVSDLRGIQTAVIEVNGGEKFSDCTLDTNSTSIVCPIPPMKKPETGKRNKRSVAAEEKKQSTPRAAPTPASSAIIINDQIRIPLEGDTLSLTYVPDPIIKPLTLLPCLSDSKMPQARQTGPQAGNDSAVAELEDPSGPTESTTAIQLTGANLNYAATLEDYDVKIVPVGVDTEPIDCEPYALEVSSLICKAPTNVFSKYVGKNVQVTIKVGNLSFSLPTVEYCPSADSGGFGVVAIAVTVTVVVVLVVIIFGLILCNRQRAKKQQKEREQIMLMLDTLENKTRENARKAYFELQAGYMTTLTDNLSDSITYLPPVSCFMRALFNDWAPDHPMVSSKTTDGMPSARISGIDGFIHLLRNQDFLVTLIRTLEEQKHFTVKEKGQFASLLTVVLFDDLVYFTRVMLDLLSELIQKHVSKNPKLLLRRSESVVEKMVSHWLCINLYSQCIREQAGKPLFLLTKAIHFLVSSAPCDVVANKAVNSLNEMTLLGSEVTFEVITLSASVMENGQKSASIEVKVVNCDTITQVKEKIIEVFYRDRPFSECPKPDEMELEFVAGQGHLVISDIDNMCHEEGTYTQINTLKHYNVKDGATVLLSPVRSKSEVAEVNGNSSPPAPRKRRLYHLMHPGDKEVNGYVEEDETGGSKTKAIIGNLINRPFQEIYLTRMVKSKTTVQEYVDGVFNAILSPTPISRAVKYFFQFLDREAAKHKISDPEVVHIWKTNSLLLRYWVNVLKNPEFLFDVNKTMIVDSCLNVITQAFMDACTTTNHKLGQDSPSNKLLYAKDAQRYKKMVGKFFDSISKETTTPDEAMNESLCKVSQEYASEFNKRAAAEQLYSHLERYKSQVQAALSDDHPDMCPRLDEIIRKLSPDSNGHSHEPVVV